MRFFLLFLLTPIFVFPVEERQMEKIAIEKVLKKDFERALKIYEDLYKKNPQKSSVLQNLANLYILLKKEEKAEEILKNLIKIEADKAYAYKILRILLLKKGKELEWLRISADWHIKTKNEESLKAQIGALVRIGNLSQAIKLIKKKIPFPEFEKVKNHKIKNLILLITLDTFRFDLLKGKTTPNLIELMEKSYFFKNIYAVAPITLPAHCSIFTGLYPRHNGVKDNSIYKLKEEAETIPEILKNYGYESYGFISSYLLNRRFGLNQGFKVYQDNFIPLDKKKHFPSTRRAFDTISEAIKFLNKVEEDKAFFFIHLYDTHAPYEPPFPFDEAYPENPYRGEGVYMDFVLGKFFEILKESGLYEKSLIIVISDHGESLGENNEPTHGFLLYEPTLHIPFILHLPEQKIKKEMDIRASQVDVLPTILSILKIKHKKLDGENLFNLNQEREIFSETELPLSFNWSSLFKIYKGEYSYISKPSDKIFYKKKEIKDEELKKEMEKKLKKYQNEKPFWEIEREVLDEEVLKNLKSLGYHQGFFREDIKNLPDPEGKMESLILYQRAISFEDEGNFEELYKISKQLEKREGDNPQFLSFCAEWYHKVGKEKEAMESIEKALKIDKNFSQGWFYLGFLNENKDNEKSIQFYKKALELEPKHFLARYNLSRIYLIKEMYREAEKEMLEVLKIFPEHPYTLNNLGYLYYKRDRECNKAKIFVERAYKLKNEEDILKLSYASVLCNCGEKEKGREILKEVPQSLKGFKEVLKSCK